MVDDRTERRSLPLTAGGYAISCRHLPSDVVSTPRRRSACPDRGTGGRGGNPPNGPAHLLSGWPYQHEVRLRPIAKAKATAAYPDHLYHGLRSSSADRLCDPSL